MTMSGLFIQTKHGEMMFCIRGTRNKITEMMVPKILDR